MGSDKRAPILRNLTLREEVARSMGFRASAHADHRRVVGGSPVEPHQVFSRVTPKRRLTAQSIIARPLATDRYVKVGSRVASDSSAIIASTGHSALW